MSLRVATLLLLPSIALPFLVMRAALGQTSGLEHECETRRAAGSWEQAGRARFVPQQTDPHFHARSASLTRQLSCGFRGARLLRATETFYPAGTRGRRPEHEGHDCRLSRHALFQAAGESRLPVTLILISFLETPQSMSSRAERA